MNIISNNCTGGFIYQTILKSEFQNPFIWCRILPDDFIFLLKNKEKINFNNISLEKTAKELEENKPIFYINVDDKINLYYTHYWFNKRYDKPYKENNEIKYNKIWEYIVDKYFDRLKRMKEQKETVIVLDNAFNNWDSIKKETISFCKENKIKLILIDDNEEEKCDENFLAFHHNYQHESPKTVIQIHHKLVSEFLLS